MTIVDVRLPAVFAAGHIPGAINIPASVCPYKNLPLPGKVIVYDDGVRSGDAARPPPRWREIPARRSRFWRAVMPLGKAPMP